MELAKLYESRVAGDVKRLWKLEDAESVESVHFGTGAVRYECVSCQVGCAMQCRFCTTGEAGFVRDLTAEEILGQLRDEIPNPHADVVASFSGMGEPLLNYSAVLGAGHALLDGDLVQALGLFTAGIPRGIRDLGHEEVPFDLCLSLHATNDRLRDYLMPINRVHPIRDVIAACREFVERRGRMVGLGYLLLQGINDRDADAEALVQMADPDAFYVMLLSHNPGPTEFSRSHPEVSRRFEARLIDGGAKVFAPVPRVTDVLGGCGQLRHVIGSDAR